MQHLEVSGAVPHIYIYIYIYIYVVRQLRVKGCGAMVRIGTGRASRRTRRKPRPNATLSTTNPNLMAWDRASHETSPHRFVQQIVVTDRCRLDGKTDVACNWKIVRVPGVRSMKLIPVFGQHGKAKNVVVSRHEVSCSDK